MPQILKSIFSLYMLSLSFSCLGQNIPSHEREVAYPKRYNLIDIEFENVEEKFTLSGTLITPKVDFDKVVVIVPGTGKDGRNTHYKLVDSLLQNNIAVYRYDERGVGKSGGNYINMYLFSSIRKYNDLYYCISTLQKNDLLRGKRIGVIGHSEGGIASIEAIEKGAKIDFLIQWATPIKPYEVLKHQYEIEPKLLFFVENLKMSPNRKIEIIELVNEVVQNNKELTYSKIKKKIDQRAKGLGYKRKEYKSYISNILFMNLLKKDYEKTYKSLQIPVFYIIGSNDEIVNPSINIEQLININNKNIDIEVVEGLYHMLTPKIFREHLPDVYHIDDNALSKILEWINII